MTNQFDRTKIQNAERTSQERGIPASDRQSDNQNFKTSNDRGECGTRGISSTRLMTVSITPSDPTKALRKALADADKLDGRVSF